MVVGCYVGGTATMPEGRRQNLGRQVRNLVKNRGGQTIINAGCYHPYEVQSAILLPIC